MRMPIESRLLLGLASLLAPREIRADWRREWDAEIWWWMGSHTGERWQLAAHCAGAICDAAYLRAADGEAMARLRRAAGSPAVCLALLGVLLAAIAVSSGMRETRRLLRDDPAIDPSLAILSQSLPFMGAHYGVPPAKVADWNVRARSLDGIAWYAVHGETGRAGDRFFELLRTTAAQGTLTPSSMDEPAAVLSNEYWRRRVGGTSTAIGRTIRVDGIEARIIGVLPRDFRFLELRPDVWVLSQTLATGASPALARLKPGVTAAAAQEELRTLAAQVRPTASGSAVIVEPLAALTESRLTALRVPWLALVCGTCLAALVRFRRTPRYGVFLAVKAVLALGLLLLGTLEFGSSWMTIGGSYGNLAAGAASLWLFLAGPGAVLYWCWHDQRRRCRQCLHQLTMPVTFGEGARILIERAGTELACPYGHGTLFRAEGVDRAQEWGSLDSSWRALFVDK